MQLILRLLSAANFLLFVPSCYFIDSIFLLRVLRYHVRKEIILRATRYIENSVCAPSLHFQSSFEEFYFLELSQVYEFLVDVIGYCGKH